MKFSENLYIAIDAALRAGGEIMDVYAGDFSVERKADESPLTIADERAHDVITSVLDLTNIPVLSEEGSQDSYDERKNWKRLWVVDPLDGTKEFIKRNGEFTVNIALVEDNYPVLGVIYAPALRKLFWAEKNSGVFKLKLSTFEKPEFTALRPEIDLRKPVQQKEVLPQTFTIVASRSHMSFETEEYIQQKKKQHAHVNLISSGSALKFCLVASGKAHCYPRFAPTMEWDTAAGQVLVEEAGRTLTDYYTKQRMKYNRENLLNNWFLVE